MKDRGTPKTLKEAIGNALETISDANGLDHDDKINVIFNHVKDFLSQKFTVGFQLAAKGSNPLDLTKHIWGLIVHDNRQDNRQNTEVLKN